MWTFDTKGSIWAPLVFRSQNTFDAFVGPPANKCGYGSMIFGCIIDLSCSLSLLNFWGGRGIFWHCRTLYADPRMICTCALYILIAHNCLSKTVRQHFWGRNCLPSSPNKWSVWSNVNFIFRIPICAPLSTTIKWFQKLQLVITRGLKTSNFPN